MKVTLGNGSDSELGSQQAQREARVAELDPQSRETFNALLAQNRGRLSDLLKNEKSGR